MYQIDFQKPLPVHFIGIGGISMSGLAEVLLSEGFKVSGSDRKPSALTDRLKASGAEIFIGQTKDNILPDTEVVVYTAAIHSDNPELVEARKRGLHLLTRAELLGQMMANYRCPIAVSGTHGKTTATSMLTHVLLQADLDPTISVGGILKAIGGNIRVGKSDFFVTEACEYTNSFLNFKPQISLILNIEADHLDFFKDLADIRCSFKKFAALTRKDGTVIINSDIDDCKEITKGLSQNVITFGTQKKADFEGRNITFNAEGHVAFDLFKNQAFVSHIALSVPGLHNVSNALAVIAAASVIDVPLDAIKKGLFSFQGTDRRFELKGIRNGFTVIDDYAHHPTEIAASLDAASHYPHNDLYVIFQPHTFSRTQMLFDDFVRVLKDVPHVIIPDIYAAREKDTLGMSGEKLALALQASGCNARYFSSFSAIEDYILSHAREKDLVMTMGAGNVVDIGEDLVK